jgi:hypothetical protein
MSTRLSQTIESLHEMQRVELQYAGIGDDGVKTLAEALKANTTVTSIDLVAINSATRVTIIDLCYNKIGGEGVLVIW